MSQDRLYVPGPACGPRTSVWSEDSSMVRGQLYGPRTALWSEDSLVRGQLYGPRTALWSEDSSMVPGQLYGPRTAWSASNTITHFNMYEGSWCFIFPDCRFFNDNERHEPCAEDLVEGIANASHIYSCLANSLHYRDPSPNPIFSVSIEEMGRNRAQSRISTTFNSRHLRVDIAASARDNPFPPIALRWCRCRRLGSTRLLQLRRYPPRPSPTPPVVLSARRMYLHDCVQIEVSLAKPWASSREDTPERAPLPSKDVIPATEMADTTSTGFQPDLPRPIPLPHHVMLNIS
ncbi:unnamed protein product [Clonostachys rosea f. rosea IK726]|uniref:Uncharacterized protein n=1 Tax=Clonostachys rosea f. rosea IK726 TaxID=1349383 RepID=A0ACA9UW57_BIOOC|nr:unnamed protein product [Clonostachys rosea f. rosea IK726]